MEISKDDFAGNNKKKATVLLETYLIKWSRFAENGFTN